VNPESVTITNGTVQTSIKFDNSSSEDQITDIILKYRDILNDLDNDTILFVEGEHDVMMIWQRLKIEAVAICGKISESTLRFSKIKNLRNKNIYLVFDNDKVGREYTDFFQKMFSESNVVKVVDYEGKDPDECLKNGGRFGL